MIPFEENEFGLDSGLWLELFLRHLNPDNPNLFQMPKYGKKMRKAIHKKQEKEVYFYPKKVGHCLISEMMPKVNIALVT